MIYLYDVSHFLFTYIRYKFAMQNNSNKQTTVLTVAIVIATVVVLVASAAAAASLVLERHLALAARNVGETCTGGAPGIGTPGTNGTPGTPGTC